MAFKNAWCGINAALTGKYVDEDNAACFLHLCIFIFLFAYTIFFLSDDLKQILIEVDDKFGLRLRKGGRALVRKLVL